MIKFLLNLGLNENEIKNIVEFNSLFLDEETIRETIAFPMTASGADLLMDAPTEVTEQQLREVHIKVR